jgi:hypothetical protein
LTGRAMGARQVEQLDDARRGIVARHPGRIVRGVPSAGRRDR